MRPTYEQLKMEQFLRDRNTLTWKTKIGCVTEKSSCPFVTLGGVSWVQCIPLEGNKHLLNKTDDCDEFYKTWEE